MALIENPTIMLLLGKDTFEEAEDDAEFVCRSLKEEGIQISEPQIEDNARIIKHALEHRPQKGRQR